MIKRLSPFLLTIILISQSGFSQNWTTPEVIFGRSNQYGTYLCTGIGNNGTIHFFWADDIDRDFVADSLYYLQKKGSELSKPISFVRDTMASITWVTMAVDKNQTPHLLWGETYSIKDPFSTRKIYYARIENQHWLAPVLIAEVNPTQRIEDVKLLYLPDSSLLAYWFSTYLHTIWFSYYENQQWSPPFRPFPTYGLRPSPYLGQATYPDITQGNDTNLYMTFIGNNGEYLPPGASFISPINYVENNANNRNWDKITPLEIYYSTTSFFYFTKIAITDEGTRYIIWLSDPNINYRPDDIYYSFSKDGENWSQPQNLSNMGEFILIPYIAADHSGRIHVIWSRWIAGPTGKLETRCYYVSGKEQCWSEPEEIFSGNYLLKPRRFNLTIDSKNREHLAWIENKDESDTSGSVIKYMWRDLPTEIIERKPKINEMQSGYIIGVKSYPNPFNSAVTLTVELSKPVLLTLIIYNLNGQLVKTLLQNSFVESRIQLIWKGTDKTGKTVSSGLYWYMLQAKNASTLDAQTQTGKLILLR